MNYWAFGIMIMCLICSFGILWKVRRSYKKHMLYVTSVITFFMAVAIYHNYLMGNASFLYSVSDGFSQFLPIYTDFKNLIQEGSGLPAWNF